MNSQELKTRTKLFGLKIILLVEKLPRSKTLDIINRQLLRSATSIGANYRAACRARSKADFVSKIGIVEEESDESVYWLELLIETKLVTDTQIHVLLKEANELTAIFTATGRTTKEKQKNE
ncbi:MAG: four helix bundle protein [Chlamydiae bacterium]|nr:four helix bundle protein [Chlamydiota bacterium]MBI3276458.1 four helix bundle protein [Chlamydiota bacterium]